MKEAARVYNFTAVDSAQYSLKSSEIEIDVEL